MINSLRIQEYKCFSDQTLPIGALTLLAGANATGKSTVIQSLLLLRQSHLRGTLPHGELLLNGPLVSVGTALDAVNETAVTDTVTFTISDDDGREQRFAFDYPRGAGESYTLRGAPGVSYNTDHCLFAPRFNYLNAERVGPRVLYPMSEMIEDLVDIGIHGEYMAHCLDRFGSASISNTHLVHGESTSSPLLLDQTRYWMSEIVPNLDIDLKAITEADQMRVGLKTSTGRFLLTEEKQGYLRNITLDPPDTPAQKLLDQALPGGKQLYALVYENNGRTPTFYEFQSDNMNGFHGYPVPEREVPSDVVRDLIERA